MSYSRSWQTATNAGSQEMRSATTASWTAMTARGWAVLDDRFNICVWKLTAVGKATAENGPCKTGGLSRTLSD